jgi:hypothetical protein
MDELKVINLKNGELELSTIRVDRGTDWGNPFVMHGEADRTRVCDLFAAYAKWRLKVEPGWLKPLKGRNLACWCAPKRCHAETLLKLANFEFTPPRYDEVYFEAMEKLDKL